MSYTKWVIIIRAFIGIEFDKPTKNYIFGIQQKLRNLASAGKWKYIDNLHLTLKFLGDISFEKQEQIDQQMREICVNKTSLTLTVSELGVFEDRQKEAIRVLWLGLAGDISKLISLSKKIDDSLYTLGFLREKRSYNPHITLGQEVVFDHELEEIKPMIGEIKFTPATVNSLFLFKSEQINNKRIYTKVSEYNLGNSKG
jgi:2'-5' RNA ligase